MTLASIEEVIKQAREGKIFILVDDENRENEGDLVIMAEKCTAEAINFMAKEARGLVCLSLTKKRVQDLKLPLMFRSQNSAFDTPFTVSIEAKEGVTTGISAYDRAKTIITAIDPKCNYQDIVTPGHVFPLQAEDGGVLVRAGHTEATVDIAKLAGLNPAAVLCEIMNDDGTMSRMPQLIKFAKKHDLKIATIADLISYRYKREQLVKKVSESKIDSEFGGEFKLSVYRNEIDKIEHVAIVKGNIDSSKPILVRVHVIDFQSDVLRDKNIVDNNRIEKVMNKIADFGSGILVLINNKNLLSFSNRVIEKSIRNYGIGAQILLNEGVKKMVLMTNSKKPVVAIEGYNLQIVGYQEI